MTYILKADSLKRQQWEILGQLNPSERCLSGDTSLWIDYHMPMPISWSKKRKIDCEYEKHVSKPDLDNLLKWTCDVLSGTVLFDDKQITQIICRKAYSKEPRTEIKICVSYD